MNRSPIAHGVSQVGGALGNGLREDVTGTNLVFNHSTMERSATQHTTSSTFDAPARHGLYRHCYDSDIASEVEKERGRIGADSVC